MKRIKKNRQILVKRIFKSLGKYDYIKQDRKTALEIIENTKSKNSDFKLEKAEWYISVLYSIKDFFKNKHFLKIIYIIIAFIIGWLLKKHFK